jgi:hypothetical protein
VILHPIRQKGGRRCLATETLIPSFDHLPASLSAAFNCWGVDRYHIHSLIHLIAIVCRSSFDFST